MSTMEINKVLSQMRSLSAGLERPAVTPEPAGANFGAAMKEAITMVNRQQGVAETMITDFQTGRADTNVADVMVAMQKASLSFTAMTQVRNKLVDAYQEIMNMPI